LGAALPNQAAEDPIDWPAYYSLFIRLFILVNVLTLWMVKLVLGSTWAEVLWAAYSQLVEPFFVTTGEWL